MRGVVVILVIAVLCGIVWWVTRDEGQADGVAPAQPQRQQAQEGEREAPQTRSRPVGESVVHGPTDYLRTTTITAPRRARKKIDKAFIQRELRQFEVLKGRKPKSLEEYEEWRGEPLPEPPSGYEYEYLPEKNELNVVPSDQSAQ